MARNDLLRWGVLLAVGAAMVPLYLVIVGIGDTATISASRLAGPLGLGLALLGLAVLSVAGALVIWRTPRAATQRGRGIELGIILGVGVVLRALVWPSLPDLSHDAYRYLWDAHLLLHGLSPYTHVPTSPAVLALRDGQVWPRLDYRTSPTIYPPAAEALFVLAGVLAPLRMAGLKVMLALADGAVALLTIALLRRRQIDPRRVIVYWWCPLPIIEFALNAHVDVAAIAWTLAALLVAEQSWRGARGVAGIFLGLAVLTKIYPILFVIALARRSDRLFFLGIAGVIVVSYLPFVGLGLGGGGYLGTYLEQQHWVNQGIAQQIIADVVSGLGGGVVVVSVAEGLCFAALCGLVAWGRWRAHWRPEVTILLLLALWMLLGPHLLPWYVPVALPFIAVVLPDKQLGSAGVWKRHEPGVKPARLGTETPTGLAAIGSTTFVYPALAFWLFVLLIPLSYVAFAPGGPVPLFFVICIVPLVVALWPWMRAWCQAMLIHQRRFSWNR